MTVRRGQSRKQEAAIAALLIAPTIAHAAQSAGISESTLTRWLRSEAFRHAYQLAQREALSQAIAALAAAAGMAVTVLRAAMLDQSASPAARVTAARAVLEFGFRGAEIADLEERLAIIEAVLAGTGNSGEAS
jgi:hypothetical protein